MLVYVVSMPHAVPTKVLSGGVPEEVSRGAQNMERHIRGSGTAPYGGRSKSIALLARVVSTLPTVGTSSLHLTKEKVRVVSP